MSNRTNGVRMLEPHTFLILKLRMAIFVEANMSYKLVHFQHRHLKPSKFFSVVDGGTSVRMWKSCLFRNVTGICFDFKSVT